MQPSVTVVIDEYPHTEAILTRKVASDAVRLDLPTFRPVRSAFAAMVNRQEFDICELALATFIQARASGSPITLLPVTMLARFQHPNLLHSLRRPLRSPADLKGRRVGVQSYAQTTGVWMRGILSRQYGVDNSDVEWVSLETPHVEGFSPPSNVSAAPAGSSMRQLLEDGVVDAAIVSRPLEGAADIAPVIEDLESATREWYSRTGVLQVNHVMCVRTGLLERDPQTVAAVLDLFWRARDSAVNPPGVGPAWAAQLDPVPFGTTALSPIVQLALQLCAEQGLVGSDLTLADLIHEAIPGIEPTAHRS